MSRKISQFIITFAAVCMTAGIAHAEFSPPQNWTRGDTNTTYQQWDLFTSLTNQLPAPDTINPNGDPTVSVRNDTNLYILTGNIYAPGGAAQIGVNVPDYGLGAGFLTTVNLQLRTQGTEMLNSSLVLRYEQGGEPQAVAPVNQELILTEQLGGPGGVLVERWFTFHVPTSPDMFDIEFDAQGPHMSLDALIIDTITTTEAEGYLTSAAIPEPGTIAMLGLATFALLRRRNDTRTCAT